MRLLRSLYVQVLLGVAAGVLLGQLRPEWGAAMRPFGDGFVKLVKMVIAPIVFCTVVTGIAHMGDLKRVGRVGLKALLYFEVLSTIALVIGLAVGELLQPGASVHADPGALDADAVAAYAGAGKQLHGVEFMLSIIPDSVVGAFARGEILGVLLFAVLLGIALAGLHQKAAKLLELVDELGKALFGVVGLVMHLAPLGAFGAMAFTVGKYGIGTLANLGKLVGCFYATSFLFVALVLGLVLRLCGVSLWRFLRYVREEIFIVLATSSSESALPRMMEKLERMGCARPVVGLVVPMGYSFNLDGTSIYLTLAVLFLSQALGIPLTFGEKLGILFVLLLTSKGAAAVTGGGFVTLAGTLSATGQIPVAGLSLLLGVDRFMSEARAITNLIGNGVATIAIARWEKSLDAKAAHHALWGPPPETNEGAKPAA